jgi:plasmid stabilization system protein ParE
MNVIFRPLAVEDIAEAATWYEARSPGLGDELIDEVLAATRRAQQNPELFRIVHRDGNVRRVSHKAFSLSDLLLNRRRNALRPRHAPRRSPRSALD